MFLKKKKKSFYNIFSELLEGLVGIDFSPRSKIYLVKCLEIYSLIGLKFLLPHLLTKIKNKIMGCSYKRKIRQGFVNIHWR